jgi:triacylglycerol lipase
MRRLSPHALLCAALLALSACASAPAQPPAPPDVKAAVDFAELLRLSEAYRTMRYLDLDRIHRDLDPFYDSLEVVDLPRTENRYMIGTREAEHRQDVWIRGTANLKNALYDLQFLKHFNARLGISLHAGFERMALAVYDDIRPRLRPGFDLVLFGHSLGAAEAVVAAMLLSRDGVRVSRVYASGQPRVTDAAGEQAFDSLPVLRIVSEGDPVPFLPPRAIPSARDPYVHLGNALILLDGPYYCLIGGDRRNEDMAASFWDLLSAEGTFKPVTEHLIPAYIDRLRVKVVQAVQVPYGEREAHVYRAAARPGTP